MKIIAGIYKNRALKAPKGNTTRPTSSRLRETVFNILQNEIENARFLDLFAGSGAMGLEALSRGASYSAFVESNRDAARMLQENIEKLNVQKQTTLLCGDCLAQLPRLARLEKPFNIIYVDPPYGTAEFSYARLLLEALDQSPILAPNALIFIEESKYFDEHIPPLQRIKFKKSRHSGRSVLYEFYLFD